MTDIENIKRVVAGLREGIANGTTDIEAVDSALTRVENILDGDHSHAYTPREGRMTGADRFFANKKKRENNWTTNPLNNR